MRAFTIAAALLTGFSASAAIGQTNAQSSARTSAQAPSGAQAPASAFERDRQAILAQTGQYRVRFDMRENVSFQPDYTPLDAKLSGGTEIVRVVYDQGDRISLQHILVMTHGEQTFVIKHWRQDWVYQPQNVLTYSGPNQWSLTPVSEAERTGAWSQTVWQTDDSPRYGGVGHWTYDNGMTAWTSNETWRPLARRDAVRNPVYDRYLGTNRHILKPAGWVHLQDNVKMSGRNSTPVAIVQEDVVNTYSLSDTFSPAPGDDYWAATKTYWAAIRAKWDEVIDRDGGIYVEEVADTGAVTSAPLMELAEKVQKREVTEAAAISQGRALIETATRR